MRESLVVTVGMSGACTSDGSRADVPGEVGDAVAAEASEDDAEDGDEAEAGCKAQDEENEDAGNSKEVEDEGRGCDVGRDIEESYECRVRDAWESRKQKKRGVHEKLR
jgi:hypothetical protein